MDSKQTLVLLTVWIAISFGDNCFNGEVYLFTFDKLVYQANLNATISPTSFYTNCYQNAVTNAGGSVLLSCSLGKDYEPTLLTISENKLLNPISYNTTCLINPIAYGANGWVWGSFQRIYYLNASHGYYEGTVVAIEQSTGETFGSSSFIWGYWKTASYETNFADKNGTCLYMASGLYSTYDNEKSTLYTISSSNIAKFNVSSPDQPVFVDKWSLLGESTVIPGSFAYDSKRRMLYAAGSNNLYRFSIDDWSYKIVNSSFPSSIYYIASMDAMSDYYVMLMDPKTNMRMLIYNVEQETYSISNIDTKLDVRAMIGYNYDACSSTASSSHTSDEKRIVEIVVPVVIGTVAIVALAAFLIHRRKRHHYQSLDH